MSTHNQPKGSFNSSVPGRTKRPSSMRGIVVPSAFSTATDCSSRYGIVMSVWHPKYAFDGSSFRFAEKLSGRSIVPMLVGFGCTVPGVMASGNFQLYVKETDQIVACLLELFCNSASHIVRSRRSFCSRRFSGSHHDCHPKAHQSDRDGWLVFYNLRHRCLFRIDSDGARHHRRIPRKDDSDSEPHAAVYCAGNH